VSIEERWTSALTRLLAIRAAAETPEHINDNPDTKPARHLERELRNPRYRKTLHGPIAAKRIGVQVIEEECHFFAGWIEKLRALENS